jgi:protein involved in polysaccharide export with SLBB domain
MRLEKSIYALRWNAFFSLVAWGIRAALLFFVSLSIDSPTIFAQTTQPVRSSPSELARQNMGRVAASAGQLTIILHRDPGLMVELKRWIAKDATDHGQLISDSELTDEAIFDRLEVDVNFRGVATVLVQKYGYLRPTLNPESPLAKQQELLIQERVKWLAQEEEEERAKQRQSLVSQAAQGCDSRNNGDCGRLAGGNGPHRSAQESPIMPGNKDVSPEVPSLEDRQAYPSPNPPENSVPRPPLSNDLTDVLRTSTDDPLDLDSPPIIRDASTAPTNPSKYVEIDENGDRAPSQRAGNVDQAQPSAIFDSASDSLSLAAESYRDGPDKNPYSKNVGSAASAGYPSPPANARDNPASRSLLQDNWLRAHDEANMNQRMVRSRSPYAGIPSLFDMYVQTSTHPTAPRRFGMQIFQNGSRDLQMIPTDLPVGPEYVLGSGDGVTVDLWGGVTRRFYRVVDREGRVSLPEVGPVLVAGKSLAEVQETVQRILRTQFHDISADVSLSRLRTIRVYVVGDVLRPGAYDVGSISTPLNALFAAGGPTARGSLRILKHFRGNTLVQEVDVYDLLLHGVKGDMQRLENGDTVMVPPLGGEITVEGMVRRPAIYELDHEKSLADALALAGGLLPTATLRHIEVQRLVAHQKQTMLSLDLSQDDSAQSATQELEGFHIEDNDRIRIFPIAPYNQDAVYLEGHVLRPGKYSFHEGMRVSDLIGSYKDLLPEPALQYGEIIRLSLPDFRPTVQSFSVAEAMADPAKSPVLQALDTLQIFSRYEFEDPPTVSVLGDVRAPGIYSTSGDIHLSDAIHLAGGLLPDAETIDAQVFRFMPDSTLKIINVRLSSALEGSPADNLVLSPRDRILVHRNAAAVDPATVYVKGEVERPGRYPLTTNMQITDLIHAAGGLKPSADLQTADLTHYLWKDQKQISGQQEQIVLADALSGASVRSASLSNGDVLAVRQLPGWADLGASITVRGEVVHPGTYGIRPGEKLSSIILRAGGFSEAAYPYGCVLERIEVQRLEQRSYGELIERVRQQQATLKLTATSSKDADQTLSAESALVQWQTTLDNLMSSPPNGRVTVQISSNIHSWANTSRDVAVRDGDILIAPKRPSYVLVQGQVYGPTAVAYRPGKSTRWYLTQAGGTTNMANRKAIFVVHADGTVVGNHSSMWLTGDALGEVLHPGDMVVAPEKALGGPPIWKTLFQNAQILSSITTSAILATAY